MPAVSAYLPILTMIRLVVVFCAASFLVSRLLGDRAPNAAKAFVAFMMEKEQYEPWQQAAIGYVTHPLKAYDSNPIWTADPKHTPYRDCVAKMTPHSYAGPLGYASAAAMADFIIVNMVAEAASGAKTPKEAAERAAARANRYYKV